MLAASADRSDITDLEAARTVIGPGRSEVRWILHGCERYRGIRHRPETKNALTWQFDVDGA
ncbi:hypothetical protein C6369_000160 [Rhodococcus rhodochrous]|nr:hypothetical protein C6369_000160 [Rhodococcus rhodochrous]